MKEQILELISMKDILNKYNIECNYKMCKCPFHDDKHASMRIYDKSYYCFTCNKTGDCIQFVEDLFGLNFYNAMQKIISDFGLNISYSKKDYIINMNNIMQQRKKKEEYKKRVNEELTIACKRFRVYNSMLKKIKSQMTIDNFETLGQTEAYLQTQLELLDNYIDKRLKKVV